MPYYTTSLTVLPTKKIEFTAIQDVISLPGIPAFARTGLIRRNL